MRTTRYLTTTGTWDRGLGVLTNVTDPTGAQTSVGYDGFGRVGYVRAPAAGHSGSSACTSNTVPVQRFAYELAVDGLPISVVRTYAEHDCSAIGAETLETRTYVDGLGRTRATLTPGSDGCDGNAAWIQSGITILNARGSVRRSYQPQRVTESVPTPRRAVQIPGGEPFEWGTFDAFGRPRCASTACGDQTCTTYHALTTDVCDPRDADPGDGWAYQTCTTTRHDGHGRAIDQILRNRQEEWGTIEYYRLWTDYRADGVVTRLIRAETTTDGLRGVAPVVSGHQVERIFKYDTMGRRIGATDPDSDSTDSGRTAANRTWRYLYNRAGDLIAVRDPRQCGQNFYYDRAGRLVGEDYVECGEIQQSGDTPEETVQATALAQTAEAGSGRTVDVRYFYEAPPTWASGYDEVSASDYEGRLAAVSDRGQRSAMAYDARGQVIWAVRQMVVIGEAPTLTITDDDPGDGLPPVVSEGSVSSSNRVYDEEHDYIRTATYDYGGRPTAMTLPIDPDWELLGGSGDAPEIGGALEYDARGLPVRVSLVIDGSPRTIVDEIQYTRDGLVCQVTYGDDDEPGVGSRTPTVSTTDYDQCRRPREFQTVRDPTSYGGSESRPLAYVTTPMHQELIWDAASNLVQILDHRDATEWPDGYRPQSVDVVHDALYRVIDAEYTYSQDSGTGPDDGRDWRDDQATTIAVDPMRTEPAPMVPSLPSERVNSLLWEYDWLGNMQQWNDDAYSFYERSIGDIENGADRATHERPSALHFASNIRDTDGGVSLGVDRGGYVEVTYGENGNVVAMTVHGQCEDRDVSTACWDDHTAEGSDRADYLRAQCVCTTEQHYEYRWDEVNRLHEARRYDRDGGSTGTWSLAVRQRYRYDSANQRTVKQTIASSGSDPERIALYVYPGDYERRGLVVGSMGDTYEASTGLETETQYLVGGARVVWKHGDAVMGFEREQRVTVALADLIQTTAAVLDLNSGALLESSTYYPNGAPESLLVDDVVPAVPEVAGFSGKESDGEVGVVYFGQRYLVAGIGRWASPDPAETHAIGGGEALNAFHYVGASLLQSHDPDGLSVRAEGNVAASTSHGRISTDQATADRVFLRDMQAGLTPAEADMFYMDSQHRLQYRLPNGVAAADLSQNARDWIQRIDSDVEYVVNPVVGFSATDRAVIRGMADSAAYSVSSATYSGSALVLRMSFRVDQGGRGGNVGVATQQGGVARMAYFTATSSRSGQLQLTTPTMARQYLRTPGLREQWGAARYTDPVFAQASIASTLVHEMTAHGDEFAAGRTDHVDYWTPEQFAAATVPERARMLAMSRSAPLIRSLERETAAHNNSLQRTERGRGMSQRVSGLNNPPNSHHRRALIHLLQQYGR